MTDYLEFLEMLNKADIEYNFDTGDVSKKIILEDVTFIFDEDGSLITVDRESY